MINLSNFNSVSGLPGPSRGSKTRPVNKDELGFVRSSSSYLLGSRPPASTIPQAPLPSTAEAMRKVNNLNAKSPNRGYSQEDFDLFSAILLNQLASPNQSALIVKDSNGGSSKNSQSNKNLNFTQMANNGSVDLKINSMQGSLVVSQPKAQTMTVREFNTDSPSSFVNKPVANVNIDMSGSNTSQQVPPTKAPATTQTPVTDPSLGYQQVAPTKGPINTAQPKPVPQAMNINSLNAGKGPLLNQNRAASVNTNTMVTTQNKGASLNTNTIVTTQTKQQSNSRSLH